jgi:hypothetical protein
LFGVIDGWLVGCAVAWLVGGAAAAAPAAPDQQHQTNIDLLECESAAAAQRRGTQARRGAARQKAGRQAAAASSIADGREGALP